MNKRGGHPWQQIPLAVYEGHMLLSSVGQLQALDALYLERLSAYPAETVAFWGVAGGNGLSHIRPGQYRAVYGVDINEAFLAACRERFIALKELVLIALDLSKPVTLPSADLVFADLLIEYIGIDAFAARVHSAKPKTLCCTIQQNLAQAFVSPSPYAQAFEAIGALHQDIAEEDLSDSLRQQGYLLQYRKAVPLNSAKQFLRLDYGLAD